MSYGWIKDALIHHYPRHNDIGDLWCDCGEYSDTNQDDGMAERWAEHVEEAYNRVEDA